MRIAPSLYNAPLLNLPEVLRVLEKENVDILHVDVMDGQFVPALSFGEKIVDEIRRSTSLYLDVHLMVREPEQFLSRFGNALVPASAGVIPSSASCRCGMTCPSPTPIWKC
ncbi:hypothetical protein [Faecalibaculum rodentium]|uniref:hypothetical protein n=1 Tax=Faecalibaculum rodentium TaxID=1702221 RepID=UPI0025A13497|nr:hypothetical protein [Faecalibaculum rodentium]